MNTLVTTAKPITQHQAVTIGSNSYKELTSQIESVLATCNARLEVIERLLTHALRGGALKIWLVDNQGYFIYQTRSANAEVEPALIRKQCANMHANQQSVFTQKKKLLSISSDNYAFACLKVNFIHEQMGWHMFVVSDSNAVLDHDSLFFLSEVSKSITYGLEQLEVIQQSRQEQVVNKGKAYKDLFEHSVDATAIADEKGYLIEANQKYLDLYGLAYDTYTSKLMLNKTYPTEIHSIKFLVTTKGRYEENVSYQTNNGHRHCKVIITNTGEHTPGNTLYLITVKDNTEFKDTQSRASFLEKHDQGTGVLNKKQFFIDAENIVKSAEASVAIFYIRLTKCSDMHDAVWDNDSEDMISSVMLGLKGRLSSSVLLGRVDKRDFVCLASVFDLNNALGVAKTILDATTGSFYNKKIEITSLIGVSCEQSKSLDINVMVSSAKEAMKTALPHGNNKIRVSNNQLNVTPFEFESELKNSIHNGQMELHFQPIYELKTRKLVSHEALLRWNHPQGMIYPDMFIRAAEHNGFIAELGAWVISQACKKIKALKAMGKVHNVSVNISSIQFFDEDLMHHIAKSMFENGVQPWEMEFEITESILINNEEKAIAMMNEMHAMGIRLSLDDFGVGYSSLTYLTKFPIQTIKIDRMFVSKLQTDKFSKAVVKAITDIAQSLDLFLIAEGVETEQQEQLLSEMGVGYGQGMLYGMAAKLD